MRYLHWIETGEAHHKNNEEAHLHKWYINIYLSKFRSVQKLNVSWFLWDIHIGIIYQCNAYHFPCGAWSRNSWRPLKMLKYKKHIKHEMFTVASVCVNGVMLSIWVNSEEISWVRCELRMEWCYWLLIAGSRGNVWIVFMIIIKCEH